MLSTPRGMMTSTYFFVCEEKTDVFREKKAHDRAVLVCSINRLVVWTTKVLFSKDEDAAL